MDSFLRRLKSDNRLPCMEHRILWMDNNFTLGVYPPTGNLSVCRDIWRTTSTPDRKSILRDLMQYGGAVRINGAPLDWFECEVCLGWIPLVVADSRKCCNLCTEALQLMCHLDRIDK
jgi:hypothetical protein